jgi:hypothetical protein
LAKWLKSILEYADIFEKISPLRQEVADLTQEKDVMAQGL